MIRLKRWPADVAIQRIQGGAGGEGEETMKTKMARRPLTDSVNAAALGRGRTDVNEDKERDEDETVEEVPEDERGRASIVSLLFHFLVLSNLGSHSLQSEC